MMVAETLFFAFSLVFFPFFSLSVSFGVLLLEDSSIDY
jgi:hypothetical protein